MVPCNVLGIPRDKMAAVSMAGPLSFKLWIQRAANLPLETPEETPGQRILITAWHEASHCVVAYLLGVPIMEVSIIPHGGARGYAMFGDLSPAEVTGAREAVAQGRVKSDIRKAIQDVALITHSRADARARAREVYAQTRAMLVENRYAVYVLAHELMLRKCLGRDEIGAVLKPHIKRPEIPDSQ